MSNATTPSPLPYYLQVLVGAAGVIFCGFFISEHTLSEHWPTTSGVLMDSRPNANSVSYRYEVKKAAFTVDQIHPASATTTENIVSVAYDPKNPAHGVVRVENMLILFCGLVISGILGAYSFFQLVGGSQIDVGWHAGARY